MKDAWKYLNIIPFRYFRASSIVEIPIHIINQVLLIWWCEAVKFPKFLFMKYMQDSPHYVGLWVRLVWCIFSTQLNSNPIAYHKDCRSIPFHWVSPEATGAMRRRTPGKMSSHAKPCLSWCPLHDTRCHSILSWCKFKRTISYRKVQLFPRGW